MYLYNCLNFCLTSNWKTERLRLGVRQQTLPSRRSGGWGCGIRLPAQSGSGGNSAWLAGSCLLTVSSCGREHVSSGPSPLTRMLIPIRGLNPQLHLTLTAPKGLTFKHQPEVFSMNLGWGKVRSVTVFCMHV